MTRSRTHYRAAWMLWRDDAARRLTHPGPVSRRAINLPAGAGPSSPRAEAIPATPPAPRGWVILPEPLAISYPAPLAPQSSPLFAHVAPHVHRVGPGTLEFARDAGLLGFKPRTEGLMDPARDPVLAAGTAEGGFTRAGARQARWLAGAWLLDRLATGDAAELERHRSARRLRLARRGLALLPLGAFIAAAWLGQPPRPEGVRAASARLWAGTDLAERFGGPPPVLKLDAPLPGTIELSTLNGANGFRANGITAYDAAGFSVSGAGDVNGDGLDDILIAAPYARPNGAYSGQGYVVYGGSAVPAIVELSTLNGGRGFVINGISAGDASGRPMAGAGDVNGDGLGDILIGAYGADPNGTGSGQSYVVYGGTAVPGTVELSGLNGTNGFRINGVSAGDGAGWAAAGAGDVNGDGLGDILIGAYGADPNGSESGQSYVVYGGSALPGTVQLSALNGSNGFRVNGVSTGDRSGLAVAGAGDVNGDGLGDILIGAPYADPNGSVSGQSYVVYGGSALPGTVQLSALNGTSGFRVSGVSLSDFSGWAVAGAGDVDGDGLADILIGAPYADPNGSVSGQSYVVYGGGALPSTVQLSALNGTSGFRVSGVSMSDFSGWAVAGAGDVDGDGLGDILIGAYRAAPNGGYSGRSYVVYGGSALPGTVQLSALGGANGFVANGISSYDQSGYAVAGAGDVNGDGFADILVGAPYAGPNGSESGQSYVVYGDGIVVPPGDCGGNGTVDAADLSSLALEIFDGDGSLPQDAPGGGFPGDPLGCNPNGDGTIDSGDLSCAVRLIFDGPGTCAAP